jgi:hypothetical protein
VARNAAIHVRKELSEALEAEAKRAGVRVQALAEEAITRHLEARKSLAHFAALKAGADWDLLDRVLARESGAAPADDDLPPAGRRGF